jgi:Protein of unknown function (DUF3298)/Deacetylase PdaC
MKLSLLLLLYLSVFCACQADQTNQINRLSNNANSNPESTENASVNEPARKIQPKAVDVSRFDSVRIKRTDSYKRFFLKIEIEYPQLKKAETAQETKFNRLVKKQVDEQISDFTKFLREKEQNAKGKGKYQYELNLTYTIDYFSNAFTSVVMNWNGFSGYLNYDYFPSTINFDLKSGKVIEQKDIFEPDAKYLEELSKLSRRILNKTCLFCGCGEGINAGDPLPEETVKEFEKKNQDANLNADSKTVDPKSIFFKSGTEPEAGNFDNWNITSEGLKITFGEYQVGPGCIGIIDIVIPFKDLRAVLRKDLNFE